MKRLTSLGTGIGWRPEIADVVEGMPGIDWVEAVSENLCPGHLPDSLLRLRERGVTVVPMLLTLRRARKSLKVSGGGGPGIAAGL